MSMQGSLNSALQTGAIVTKFGEDAFKGQKLRSDIGKLTTKFNKEVANSGITNIIDLQKTLDSGTALETRQKQNKMAIAENKLNLINEAITSKMGDLKELSLNGNTKEFDKNFDILSKEEGKIAFNQKSKLKSKAVRTLNIDSITNMKENLKNAALNKAQQEYKLRREQIDFTREFANANRRMEIQYNAAMGLDKEESK